MAPQVAWIGLGNMGRGMCKNLVDKGKLDKPLILHNRTTARAEELSEKLGKSKTKVVASIPELVSASDVIFACLLNDKAVEDTVAEVCKGDIKGKLFVDCSTVHPDVSNRISKTIEDAGAAFVACPVFGAPAMAESGQLVCVLAGPAAAVDRVKPYCAGVMGRAIIDFSDEAPGKATLLKVIGNTFIGQMIEAISEGHTVAEKTGLGSENLHKFIEAMFPGPYTAYSGRMMSGDYCSGEPKFGVDGARKDMGHALAIAKSAGARMRAVELVDDHLKAVQEHMGSKGDIAGIYGAVRQESGLKFEK